MPSWVLAIVDSNVLLLGWRYFDGQRVSALHFKYLMMDFRNKNLSATSPQDAFEYEKRSMDAVCINESHLRHPWWFNFKYLLIGAAFGIVFIKSEVISWYRIQEMFRFQSFHMYGIIGSAVLVGMISVWLIKKFKVKTIYGEEIELHSKKFNKGNVYGGILFGFGWALTGACPGPLFAQIGTGSLVFAVALAAAIFGTWTYGLLRDRLPH
jgi:hypothetical protein